MDTSINDFIDLSPRWCDGDGDACELIISSRARLARNLTAIPFVHRTIKNDLFRIIKKVETAVRTSSEMEQAVYFSLPDASELDRKVLVERRLISPSLAESDRPAGVFINRSETTSLMVNEEDHLRLQTICSGLQLNAAWHEADKIDTELSKLLDFAYSDEFGYLTACPTNVGTGIRMSVLIHLPGLTWSDQIEPVIRAMREIGFTVRGLYGEGTGTLGNLYQISNQWTLGYVEQDIVNRLDEVVQKLMDYEHKACDALLEEAKNHIEDRIWRAYGTLAHARLLSEQDALDALSMLRMGTYMKLFTGIKMKSFNNLLVITQSAHVQKRIGRCLSIEDQDKHRAELVGQYVK